MHGKGRNRDRPQHDRRLHVNALTNTNIRDAQLSELGQLAKIWFDGWQDVKTLSNLYPFL
jgi:hypothetical protein